jgi:hypothetical protein
LHDLALDNGSLRSPQYMYLYISFFIVTIFGV